MSHDSAEELLHTVSHPGLSSVSFHMHYFVFLGTKDQHTAALIFMPQALAWLTGVLLTYLNNPPFLFCFLLEHRRRWTLLLGQIHCLTSLRSFYSCCEPNSEKEDSEPTWEIVFNFSSVMGTSFF